MYPLNTPKEEQKLCKECEFVSRGYSNEYKCFAPENTQGINPVDGEKVFTEKSCIIQRSSECNPITRKAYCGSNGVWWIRRIEPPLGSWQQVQSAEIAKFGDSGGVVKVGKSTMEL